jgi:hypothetical protein
MRRDFLKILNSDWSSGNFTRTPWRRVLPATPPLPPNAMAQTLTRPGLSGNELGEIRQMILPPHCLLPALPLREDGSILTALPNVWVLILFAKWRPISTQATQICHHLQSGENCMNAMVLIVDMFMTISTVEACESSERKNTKTSQEPVTKFTVICNW